MNGNKTFKGAQSVLRTFYFLKHSIRIIMVQIWHNSTYQLYVESLDLIFLKLLKLGTRQQNFTITFIFVSLSSSMCLIDTILDVQQF